MVELVFGGARSGKSRYSEMQVLAALSERSESCQACYIATAQALDNEMHERITTHRQDRMNAAHTWLTFESPLNLTATLVAQCRPERVMLVDCLTLWLSNHLHHSESDWPQVKTEFLATLPTLAGHIILVSNEVGCGVVPLGELTRRFVDEVGRLHQDIARLAQKVTFVTAGLPMILKG